MRNRITLEREQLRRVFSRQLRTAMLARGWNMAQLARYADVRADAICRYANGEKMPSAYTLDRLASTLDVSVDWLLGRAMLPQALQ